MRHPFARISGLALIGSLLAGCPPPLFDDGYYDPLECDYEPDLVVESFTFEDYGDPGTVLDFQDITVCNWGGGTAESGYTYEVWLSQSPDAYGENQVVFESGPMVGVASWDCVSVDPVVPAGDLVPEGYYYVIVYVDYYDELWECDESNNWSISDDAIWVSPGPAALR